MRTEPMKKLMSAIATAISDAWYKLGAWYTVKRWCLFADAHEAAIAGVREPVHDHRVEHVLSRSESRRLAVQLMPRPQVDNSIIHETLPVKRAKGTAKRGTKKGRTKAPRKSRTR
jgi:hypothetical protein